MEKYENIDKLFSMVDSLLGFIFSVPWWGWVIVVLSPAIIPLIIVLLFEWFPKILDKVTPSSPKKGVLIGTIGLSGVVLLSVILYAPFGGHQQTANPYDKLPAGFKIVDAPKNTGAAPESIDPNDSDWEAIQ